MPLVVPGINSKDTSALSADADNTITNPVIPSEETIKAGVFDKKEGEYKQEGGAGEKRKPEAEYFTAMPGPVIPEDKAALGEKVPREELHARAEELNK
ncbi:hypothetical protein L873DRAFT_1803005 [Choiromyces venosus 120613-1]|uniref:Uncharacterized protein n=1 Tax=Choiromyces venosus 120613-1 TaxID=1336337 RepID=A0A3N4JU86_9PEZI|nr:hypothetical protein L873DRAFT_1803005 [Choiromyces venosus 120613-1]